MTDKIKNWLIKKLGGITPQEVKDILFQREKTIKYNIHFPEYKHPKTGQIHLHQCPLGNWKDNKDDWCVPIPFERTKDGVIFNSPK